MSRRVPERITQIPLNTDGDTLTTAHFPGPLFEVNYEVLRDTPLPRGDPRHNCLGFYRPVADGWGGVCYRVLLIPGSGQVDHVVIPELAMRVTIPKWVNTYGELAAYFELHLANMPGAVVTRKAVEKMTHA